MLPHWPPLLAQPLLWGQPQSLPFLKAPPVFPVGALAASAPHSLSSLFAMNLPKEVKKPAWFSLFKGIQMWACAKFCFMHTNVRPGTKRQRLLTFEDKMQHLSWSFIFEVQCIKNKLICKSDAGHKAINKHWTTLSIGTTACHYKH